MNRNRIVMVWLLAGAWLALSRATAQAATPNQKFVNQLYLDLVNRPASAGELSTLSSQLDSASITRTQAAGVITSSDEFLGDQVGSWYQLLLHRAPGGSEATSSINAIKLGQTFENTQAFMAGSSEYFINRGESTNDGFLDALYADELRRAVDPASRSSFDSFLTGGGTRTQVAQTVLTSTEYRQDLVGTYYNEFLRRSPLPADLSSGVSFLGSSTDQNYIDSIVGSTEYFNLAQTIPEPGGIAVASLGMLTLKTRHRRRRGPAK
jgi:hypothetical protein